MSKLYVGSLAGEAGEDTLRSAFARDGSNVPNAAILRETGRLHGFACDGVAFDADAAAVGVLDGCTPADQPRSAQRAARATADVMAAATAGRRDDERAMVDSPPASLTPGP